MARSLLVCQALDGTLILLVTTLVGLVPPRSQILNRHKKPHLRLRGVAILYRELELIHLYYGCYFHIFITIRHGMF